MAGRSNKGPKGLMVAIGIPKGGPAGEPDGDEGTAGAGGDVGVRSAGGAGQEDCVPLDALAVPDAESGDQMTNPDVGDRVSYTVEGTVKRIAGANAYVERDAVNGKPVEKGAAEAEPEPGPGEGEPDGDEQDRAELGGMAARMDQGG